ncbi:MAG: helix-turn-helix domain-containing protein [Clostridiales bacterium]|nr:helix-turn-helix domain-containing protein [Clostridiales bacterium]MCD8369894.1 helix-turn-helix domain-containing protein [Clostridiales bacterium]
MPKPRGNTGQKNLIADQLKELRTERGYSQRQLAAEFQLRGIDIDKNVITRLETNQRYATDIEVSAIMRIFHVSFEQLTGQKFEEDQ